MKAHFKLSIAAVSLIFIISACSSGSEGVQGEWSEFSYTIGPDSYQTKVLVENSYYSKYRGKIRLEVEWKGINTGKRLAYFNWVTQALMDSDGRMFVPTEGTRLEKIQPLDETSSLKVIYYLPGAVEVDELYWGVYNGNLEEGLKYKVKLTPERKE